MPLVPAMDFGIPITDNNAVDIRLQLEQGNIGKVVEALRAELDRFGLQQPLLVTDLVNVTLRTDPFDGSQTLCGEWRDGSGQLLGSLQLMPSGQVFAECDVLCPHPGKSRWFVEAVTAWGDINALRTELRLLPAINDPQ